MSNNLEIFFNNVESFNDVEYSIFNSSVLNKAKYYQR